MSPQTVTPKIAADTLRVSKRSVITWCQKGMFPGAETDAKGRWSIPVAEVEKLRVERQKLISRSDSATAALLQVREYYDHEIAKRASALVDLCNEIVKRADRWAKLAKPQSVREVGERADRQVELWTLLDALAKPVDEWRGVRQQLHHVEGAIAASAALAEDMKELPAPVANRKKRGA